MKKIIFIASIVFISSCDQTSCDTIAGNFSNGYECNLILEEKKIIHDVIVQLKGSSPIDGKERSMIDGSKWLLAHFDKFKIGDTILKVKGSGTILIKRKDGIVPIYYTCNGRIYK